MLVLEFVYSKSTSIVQQKIAKNQHVKLLLITNQHMYPKNVNSKSPVHGHDPRFWFPQQYKTVPSVYKKKKKTSKCPLMPKFEANMNYIPPNPPSSMKHCK